MAVRFEWDENKNRINIQKHRVGFDEAKRVFSDPRVTLRKDRVVEGEERWHAIGYVERHSVSCSFGPRKRPSLNHSHHLGPQSDTSREEIV